MDKLHDVELSPRGLPRNLGLKLGKTTPKTYEARITLLTEGHPVRETIAVARLAARAELARQFASLDRQARAQARRSEPVQLLMTMPGVGAYFGLPQKRYQPGETDIAGRISKLGDDFEKRMPTSNCVAMIAQTPPVP